MGNMLKEVKETRGTVREARLGISRKYIGRLKWQW